MLSSLLRNAVIVYPFPVARFKCRKALFFQYFNKALGVHISLDAIIHKYFDADLRA
jgi:hypothetical protein